MGRLAPEAPVKRAVINESTAASNEIVAAVAGKSIVVLGVTLVVGGAVSLTWQTSTGPAALSGAMLFDKGYTEHEPETGLFETVAGDALHLLSSAAVQVSGYLSYVEV